MKKVFISVVFSLVLIVSVKGQELPKFSQFYRSMMIINPSVTGIDDYLDIKLGYKDQWSGIDGSPRTFFASFNANLNSLKNSYALHTGNPNNPVVKTKVLNKNGLGFYFFSDMYGPAKQTMFMINYAQHYRLSQKVFFSLGIAAGINNLIFDEKLLSVKDFDPYYNDFILNARSTYYFDASAGASIYGDRFYLGYSVNHLLGDKASFNDNPYGDFFKMHHNFFAGLNLKASSQVKILPGLMIRYINGTPLEFDLSLRARFKDFFVLGASLKDGQVIGGTVGIILNNYVNFSYSYDYSFSKLKYYNKGTHEIILGINLMNFKKEPSKFVW